LHSTKWNNGKKGWKSLCSRKIIQPRIQWEMKKRNTWFLTPNNEKCHEGVQQFPQKHPQRRNLTRSHCEIHEEDTTHGYPKTVRYTQEISRHQK
jgi:hypothetical protein